MAAVTELSFLLFALINNIHAEEQIIIQEEGYSYTFNLPENTNSCLISRSVGEEKLVLWNTSDLWSNSSSVPEHLKQRLVSTVKTSSYTILHLTHSDSGPYQEECWTEGNVTHENNITITVCTISIDRRGFGARLGETVNLPCKGAADNLDIQWLKQDSRYEQETWSRVFGNNMTSVMDNVRGRYQVVTNTSALRVSNVTTTDLTLYRCLVMNQQQCVSRYTVQLVPYEIIYHSVGETAVLSCTITDSNDEQPPRWMVINKTNSITHLGQQNQTVPSVDQNYSLVFSSLMLNHSGRYYCKVSRREQRYDLVVCPKFGPPAVELFSEGEEVTLRCRDWREDKVHGWFIKSHQKEGRIFSVRYQSMSRVSWSKYDNGNLVISNISMGDAGEYWCVVYDPDGYQCESTERTVLVWL
ncbi:uncharacterized protein LOC118495325 [Sander lucioperca]|uniref:uncharacterized protein LOC118495325 n=1 Tax=Sander lucioperca TaxID=283035 RepID=UPI0016539847|nr:uncharacterized protein LOC118495325 [Sander lucioperca]